jgi:hypothetical protein
VAGQEVGSEARARHVPTHDRVLSILSFYPTLTAYYWNLEI